MPSGDPSQIDHQCSDQYGLEMVDPSEQYIRLDVKFFYDLRDDRLRCSFSFETETKEFPVRRGSLNEFERNFMGAALDETLVVGC